MAYVECKVKSKILQTTVPISLYFPNDRMVDEGNQPKAVLTLLHGYSGCGKDWFLNTNAVRYAGENGIVLIAPDCGNSFYHNMMYGGAYRTFLLEEMPILLSDMFKMPKGRDKNFIAGLSMGGYGALYLGLSRPDRYAGCASFSGAVDLAMMLRAKHSTGIREVFSPIFGHDLVMPASSDLHRIAQKVAALPHEKQPKILMTNGLQDHEPYHIVAQNDALHQTLHGLSLANYRRLQWNGKHDWHVWDRSLVYAIDYFLQNGYADKKLAEWRSSAVASE